MSRVVPLAMNLGALEHTPWRKESLNAEQPGRTARICPTLVSCVGSIHLSVREGVSDVMESPAMKRSCSVYAVEGSAF